VTSFVSPIDFIYCHLVELSFNLMAIVGPGAGQLQIWSQHIPDEQLSERSTCTLVHAYSVVLTDTLACSQ